MPLRCLSTCVPPPMPENRPLPAINDSAAGGFAASRPNAAVSRKRGGDQAARRAVDICRGTVSGAAGAAPARARRPAVPCTAVRRRAVASWTCSGDDGPADRALGHPAGRGRDPRAAAVPHHVQAVVQFGPQRPPGPHQEHPAPGRRSPRPGRARRPAPAPSTPACSRAVPSTRRPRAAGTSSASNRPAGGQQHGVRPAPPPAGHPAGVGAGVVLPGLERRMAAHDRAAGPAAGEAVTGEAGARGHRPAVCGVAQRAPGAAAAGRRTARSAERSAVAPLHGSNNPRSQHGRRLYQPRRRIQARHASLVRTDPPFATCMRNYEHR